MLTLDSVIWIYDPKAIGIKSFNGHVQDRKQTSWEQTVTSWRPLSWWSIIGSIIGSIINVLSLVLSFMFYHWWYIIDDLSLMFISLMFNHWSSIIDVLSLVLSFYHWCSVMGIGGRNKTQWEWMGVKKGSEAVVACTTQFLETGYIGDDVSRRFLCI